MQSLPQIAVIADDLTGALDSTVAFSKVGLRCVVASWPASLQAALDERPDVIAVSTNSRDLTGSEAALVVTTLAQLLVGIPILFKKVDSRLKGNIAAEVAALMQVSGRNCVLLCPAIPQMGRFVVDGALTGFGIGAVPPVADILSKLPGLSVVTPDAATDDDIDKMLHGISARTLLVGASGLSAGLARRMKRAVPKPVDLPLARPILYIIGTRDPITMAQVAHLRQSQPGARYVAAQNGTSEGKGVAADVMILQATPGADRAAPETVTRELSKAFMRRFPTPANSLVLTGGETAAAVLAEMKVGVLEIMGEALPGLPICRVIGNPDAPLIVTKSGGFGEPDTLSRLLTSNPYPQAPKNRKSA